jgi:formamidopyrimidine-DNA glycosylase
MPELPEVETIRNILRFGKEDQPSLLGKLIQSAQVLWSRSLAFPTPSEFQERISGQTILDIGRRGKFLIFYLSDNMLIMHLRMSGDIFVMPEAHPLAAYDRVVFHLDGSVRLAFNDMRKFGRVWLVEDAQQVLGGLGPEPLDISLSQEIFYERLCSAHRQLKPLLLDQSFIAGMGNIYTDEALHRAHLHPLERSNLLSLEQGIRLFECMRKVLEDGILRNGASIDWVYRGGDFQNYFRVYQRTGQPCLECGTPIVRILVGQRGTHFCPTCQVRSD